MLTLADRVFEMMHKPSLDLPQVIVDNHPTLNDVVSMIKERLRLSRKYVIEQDALSTILDQKNRTLDYPTLMKRLPTSIPKHEYIWIEYTLTELDHRRNREGLLLVVDTKTNSMYAGSMFVDDPLSDDPVHICPIGYFVGTNHLATLNNREQLPDDFFQQRGVSFTEDEARLAMEKCYPLPDPYFIKPILESGLSVRDPVYQQLAETVMMGYHNNLRIVLRTFDIVNSIINIPLTYTNVIPASPFRLKGKAQKIPRLRGIQKVSLSLEKGWTVKRYLKNAVKEHTNGNTGITQGEHSVREHDRVYYRGTDKEYTVKIGSYRKGSGLTKTERRFIVTE